METISLTRKTVRNRSLRFHWRAGLAVVLGAAAGSAALIGALFVGDSMRASLRTQALARLGPVDYALESGRFFREALAEDLAASGEIKSQVDSVCPLVMLRGAVSNAETDARVNDAQVLGVDARFWQLFDRPEDAAAMAEEGRSVILNWALADELGVETGDDVLLRLPKPGEAPLETLLGRRDDTVASLRLTVSKIIEVKAAGAFALQQRQAAARSAYVPLAVLQRLLGQSNRVNTLLVCAAGTDGEAESAASSLSGGLDEKVTLSDFNLKLQVNQECGFAALESSNLLIDPPVESAALESAKTLGLESVPILTYLANSISVVEESDGGSAIPYSTVAALDPARVPTAQFVRTDGSAVTELADDAILINEWAAEDLGVKSGDRISLTYFVSLPGGRLEERTAQFSLSGIVRMTGWAADPKLTPTYEGITNARRLTDWDPPFPFDMKRIREKDEDYWDDHKALPKAFISRAAGQRLWHVDNRFGAFTSIRVISPASEPVTQTAERFEEALRARLKPQEMGLAFRNVRMEALAAGGGSTDFGQLFIGFSSFLIIAAAMLVALMFRLGVERRASEVGLLQAVGFGDRGIRKLLISEGSILVVIGTVLGLALAGGYAWLMLAGLRSWWSAAVNAPFLQLAVEPVSVLIGFVSSYVIARIAVRWAFRIMARNSASALLAGQVASGNRSISARARATLKAIFFLSILAAIGTALSAAYAEGSGQAISFFVAGFAMLTAFLTAVWMWLVARPAAPRSAAVRLTTSGLAVRNARRQPARSLLATGLIAAATFVIVAVGASRKGAEIDIERKTGGTGGFSVIADSTVPLAYDISSPEGRDSLGLSSDAKSLCNSATIAAFRVRPGDDSSCLNLYKVNNPRVLGARDDCVKRGGFSFSSTMAESPEEKANPWLLLKRRFPDGAVPAIGDESAVRWLLHLGLGDDMPVIDERGETVNLRIVAMLSGSVLQGELIIAEDRFRDLFPSIGGYSSFLIATDRTEDLIKMMERDLSRFGFDAEPARERLARFMAVENTYMSTFQTLGGLGLLLGVVGLAAVMMRNIWERRGELALLRALGLRFQQLFRMSLLEHSALLVTGLIAGALSALLAVAPHALSQPGEIPWMSLAGTILLVLLVGLVVGALCIRSTLKTPLLAALRRE